MFGMDFCYNPWAYAAEKSQAAIRRENEARDKFNYLKSQMDLALYENSMTMIGLACHAKSKECPLKLLPGDVMEHVLAFAGIGGASKPRGAGVKAAAAATLRDMRLAIVPNESASLNLADIRLFQPGSKIVIPLTKPNLHLTQSCYRDLRRHVKRNENWDVVRKAATPEEKRQYRESRKGTVYFINAIYKVPGKAATKKRERTSSASIVARATANDGKAASSSKGAAASAVGSKKRPATAKTTPKPALSPGTQGKATSALRAAMESAANDADGNVETEVFMRALTAGYSKQFILDKVAAHLKSLKDTKPPAKKKAKTDEVDE